MDAENTYYLYSDREFEMSLRNGHWHKRIGRRFSFLPGTVWLQTDAKKMATHDGVDVFWGAAHALPLGLPSFVRRVLTINDLVWPDYSETMSLYNRIINRLFFKRSIREANVILVPSRSTQRGLESLLAAPDSRIRFVPYGVEECFQPRDRLASARRTAQRYGTSEDYLCCVGTIEPRKNLATLIEAARILRDRHQTSVQLVIAGARGWKDSALHKRVAASGFTEKEIKFLGYVPEQDMPYLYAGASVFVFPSLYEGFGFPLLEAMACGAPIVASNVSSIPEVADGAALLVDPQQAGELAAEILRVRSTPILREQLVRNGLSRATQFRWEAAAQATLAVLNGSANQQSAPPELKG